MFASCRQDDSIGIGIPNVPSMKDYVIMSNMIYILSGWYGKSKKWTYSGHARSVIISQ